VRAPPFEFFFANRPAAVLAIVLAMLTIAGFAGCGTRSQRTQAESNQAALPSDPANSHTVSVTFDYDFKKNPPCAPNAASKTCVKQFNVYDVSGGRYKLFVVPAPAGATGVVKGIGGKSTPRQLEPGTHFIAVTAENSSGGESDVNLAKVSVEVKRKSLTGSGAAPGR